MTDDDGRYERVVNFDTLEQIRRFAERWHRFGGHVMNLHEVLSDVKVRNKPMPEDLFGAVVSMPILPVGRRWSIRMNDRLPIAAYHATLGHEFTHTFQDIGQSEAMCQPYGELPPLEQEAHGGGALFTVPFSAIEHAALGDVATRRRIATEYQVPTTYVLIRNCLAVFLGEKPGDERDASAYLNGAMLRHQAWMANIADYIQMQAERPLASSA